ncbi:MAG: hypothetical protein ACOYUZ_05000 [Patescibacteria group bacterium]
MIRNESSLDNPNNKTGGAIFKIHTPSAGLNGLMGLMLCAILLLGALLAMGCGMLREEEEPSGQNNSANTGDNACFVGEVRYPTSEQDFSDDNLLYGNRGFLSSYNGIKHLGTDIIYAAGTPIHPIACGRLVIYRSSQGYGTLVAVMEHQLTSPITVINGDGEPVSVSTFLSIYGHGSATDPVGNGKDLTWKAGDQIRPSDTVMYIQTNALNGDGPEHLHLGIRLQSAAEAQKTDPGAWFRGNDTASDAYKKYYTDPVAFIPALMEHAGQPFSPPSSADTTSATNHPIGTLLYSSDSGQTFMVVRPGEIMDVSNYQTVPFECAVKADPVIMSCYKQTTFDALSLWFDSRVIKFDGEPQVYQLYPGNGFELTGYRAFLSYESFLSWGYAESDIEHHPLADKGQLIGNLNNMGGAGFMPGALAKGKGASTVFVANQNGNRQAIINYGVFERLAYNPDCIFEVEEQTLDAVAGNQAADFLDEDQIDVCHATSHQICTPGQTIPCECPDMSWSNQVCLPNGESYGSCECGSSGPGGGGEAGQGGAGGASGSGGASGAGGESGSSGFAGSSGSAGSAGSGGTSGTAGSSGSGGTSGAGGSSNSGMVAVGLSYEGPAWTLPVFTYKVGSNAWGPVPGCDTVAPQTANCSFELPVTALDSFRWQVSLGMDRYWGDTSGLAPAPCVPATDLPNYFGTSVTVLGTVSLTLDGVPTEFGLCSNGIINPGYSNMCGESQFPYMNGCLNP